MTFMIILGAVAAVFILMLLFRLAALALPVYAGIGAGFWMLERGSGYGVSIAAGLLVGAMILGAGRLLCSSLPPLYRLPVALAFAVPAAFAGYQAASGLAGLAVAEGLALTSLGIVGAALGAYGAWRSLEGPPPPEITSHMVRPRLNDGALITSVHSADPEGLILAAGAEPARPLRMRDLPS